MQPIGINFLPSEEQAMRGPQQGSREGDLGAAFKILSLNLPPDPSVHGIAPQELLQAPGSQRLPAGMNPLAAVFEALLRGLQPRRMAPPAPMGGLGSMGAPRIGGSPLSGPTDLPPVDGPGAPPPEIPRPRIVPREGGRRTMGNPF